MKIDAFSLQASPFLRQPSLLFVAPCMTKYRVVGASHQQKSKWTEQIQHLHPHMYVMNTLFILFFLSISIVLVPQSPYFQIMAAEIYELIHLA